MANRPRAFFKQRSLPIATGRLLETNQLGVQYAWEGDKTNCVTSTWGGIHGGKNYFSSGLVVPLKSSALGRDSSGACPAGLRYGIHSK